MARYFIMAVIAVLIVLPNRCVWAAGVVQSTDSRRTVVKMGDRTPKKDFESYQRDIAAIVQALYKEAAAGRFLDPKAIMYPDLLKQGRTCARKLFNQFGSSMNGEFAAILRLDLRSVVLEDLWKRRILSDHQYARSLDSEITDLMGTLQQDGKADGKRCGLLANPQITFSKMLVYGHEETKRLLVRFRNGRRDQFVQRYLKNRQRALSDVSFVAFLRETLDRHVLYRLRQEGLISDLDVIHASLGYFRRLMVRLQYEFGGEISLERVMELGRDRLNRLLWTHDFRRAYFTTFMGEYLRHHVRLDIRNELRRAKQTHSLSIFDLESKDGGRGVAAEGRLPGPPDHAGEPLADLMHEAVKVYAEVTIPDLVRRFQEHVPEMDVNDVLRLTSLRFENVEAVLMKKKDSRFATYGANKRQDVVELIGRIRKILIFCQRGPNAGGDETLETTGAMFGGLTKERVRQIMNEMTADFADFWTRRIRWTTHKRGQELRDKIDILDSANSQAEHCKRLLAHSPKGVGG